MAQKEGVRNNNPGNIRYGEFAKKLGATGKDDKGFAIFPDYQSGEQAIAKLLDTKSYKNLSGKQAMMRYAPPSENNTSNYIAFMEKKGVPMDKKVSDMTPEEKQAMVNAIVHYENGMPPERIASIVGDTSTVASEPAQQPQEGYSQQAQQAQQAYQPQDTPHTQQTQGQPGLYGDFGGQETPQVETTPQPTEVDPETGTQTPLNSLPPQW